MGEVEEFYSAVDQGKAKGYKGVNGTGDDAVKKYLNNQFKSLIVLIKHMLA